MWNMVGRGILIFVFFLEFFGGDYGYILKLLLLEGLFFGCCDIVFCENFVDFNKGMMGCGFFSGVNGISFVMLDGLINVFVVFEERLK